MEVCPCTEVTTISCGHSDGAKLLYAALLSPVGVEGHASESYSLSQGADMASFTVTARMELQPVSKPLSSYPSTVLLLGHS